MSLTKIVCGDNFTTNLIKDNINGLIDESVLVSGDVTTLQSDVVTLQTDSTSLRTDVDDLKENTTLYNGIKTLPQIEGTVLNVKGFYADTSVGGGQFYYDPLKDKTEHNGGTIIAPEALVAWDGTQADIATLLDWTGAGAGCFVRTGVIMPLVENFGGTALLDSKASALRCHAAFGEMGTKTKIKISELAGISVLLPIKFNGYGVGEFCGFGNNDIVSVPDTTFKSIEIINVSFSDFRRLINTGPSTSDISCDYILVDGSKFNNCELVLNCQFREVPLVRVNNNIFTNMLSVTSVAGGMIIGQGSTSSVIPLKVNNVVVSNNSFSSILSEVVDQEAHAIMVHGNDVTIQGNSISGCRNASGSLKNAEGIYVKAVCSTISGNTLVDAGFSENGAIASKGAIKGGTADPLSPLGAGLSVVGNTIRYTDPLELSGGGVSIHMDNAECNSNVFIGLTSFAVRHTNGDRGLDISHNTIFDHYGEQCISIESNIKCYTVAYNNVALIGRASLHSTVIFLQPLAGGTQSSGSIIGNKVYASSSFVGERILPLYLNAPTGRTLSDIELSGNKMFTSGAASALFYAISLTGPGIISGLKIERNTSDVKNDSWCRVLNSPTLSDITKSGNRLNTNKLNTSFTVTHGRDDCRFNVSSGNYTLIIDGSTSPEGITFTLAVSSGSASNTISLTNGLSFIGGGTSMVVSGVGYFRCTVGDGNVVDIEMYRGSAVYS